MTSTKQLMALVVLLLSFLSSFAVDYYVDSSWPSRFATIGVVSCLILQKLMTILATQPTAKIDLPEAEKKDEEVFENVRIPSKGSSSSEVDDDASPPFLLLPTRFELAIQGKLDTMNERLDSFEGLLQALLNCESRQENSIKHLINMQLLDKEQAQGTESFEEIKEEHTEQEVLKDQKQDSPTVSSPIVRGRWADEVDDDYEWLQELAQSKIVAAENNNGNVVNVNNGNAANVSNGNAANINNGNAANFNNGNAANVNNGNAANFNNGNVDNVNNGNAANVNNGGVVEAKNSKAHRLQTDVPRNPVQETEDGFTQVVSRRTKRNQKKRKD